MPKCCTILNDLLYDLDFFKFSFSFTFDQGNHYLSTSLGKFLSLSLAIVLVVLISRSDIVNRRNPYIELKNLHQENPTPTLLTGENFRLQFGLYGRSFNFIPVDPTIFNIQVEKIKSSQTELMRPVSYEVTQLKYKQDSYLPLYGLEDNDIVLEGSFNEVNGTYLKVSLFFCDNVTSNNTCKSQQEMNSFLLAKALAIFYRDSSINFDDYEDPLKFSENTELIVLDPNLTKQYQLNIKKGDFIDDKGFFFKGVDYTKAMINKDNSNMDFAAHLSGEELGYFFIALSRNTQRITRSYPKIGELFSSLLVVYNVFVVLGTILMKRLQKIKIFDYIFEEKMRESRSLIKPMPDAKNTNISLFIRFKKRVSSKIINEQTNCPTTTNNNNSKRMEVSFRDIIKFLPENIALSVLKFKTWLGKKKKKEIDYDKLTNVKNFLQILYESNEKKYSNLTFSEFVLKKPMI